MRWPHDPMQSAVTRRDDNLARTRRLSAWIAGGATAASLALAAALGYVLPGHSYASTPAGHTGSVTGQHGSTGGGGSSGGGQRSGGRNGGSGSGSSGGSGSQGGGGTSNGGGLAPPQQPPSGSTAPPVVSSGGS
jgi:hypothetical protein